MKNILKCGGFLYDNTANTITMARIIMTIWLIGLLFSGSERKGLMLFLAVLCAVSDLADGFVARKLQIISRLGSFLDPLTDKLFVIPILIYISVYIAWTNEYGYALQTASRTIITCLIWCELMLMTNGGVAIYRGMKGAANKFGKRKMFLESVAVIFWLGFFMIGEQTNAIMIYLIDAILILATYYAVRSIIGHCGDLMKKS